MFRHFREKEWFNFISNYNPDNILELTKTKIYNICRSMNLDCEFEIDYTNHQDIKRLDLYCVLIANIKSDLLGVNAVYKFNIPYVEDNVFYKGFETRFLQKQIRDYLYIVNKERTYLRLFPDIDIEIILNKIGKTESTYLIDIRDVANAKMMPLYYYLLEDGEENKFKNIFEKLPESLQKDMENCDKAKDKDDILKLSQSINSLLRVRRSVSIIKSLYNSSNIIQKFCNSPADLLYEMYISLLKGSSDENGLDLNKRRIRTTIEMIIGSLISQFIYSLTSNLFLTPAARRNKISKEIDVIKDLYDFVILEQLPSPLAILNDKSRVTLTGKFGFNRDNVPIKLKNLHQSHFGKICPVVTPDRAGTGIILSLATSCKYDENGVFINDISLETYSKGE